LTQQVPRYQLCLVQMGAAPHAATSSSES
jgi:hypothetical protein